MTTGRTKQPGWGFQMQMLRKMKVGLVSWVCGLLVGLVVVVVGCGGSGPAPAPPGGKPRVVATFFPVYDFAARLGGEEFEVECLVPPGGDPHGTEPTPEMARRVVDARVVLALGLGMDGWVAKLAGSERPGRLVSIGEGLATRKVGLPTLGGEVVEAGGGEHDAEEPDPHIWLDPVIAVRLAERIAAALVTAQPSSRERVESRLRELVGALGALDREFAEGLAGVKRRDVVTFHGAFGYLFDRYQLRTVAVVEMFPGDEPSSAYLRRLVDLMRREGMRTIFAEPQLPDGPARMIAAEIGGGVERLDPCETRLVDEPGADYFMRQRANLQVLRRVLGVGGEAR